MERKDYIDHLIAQTEYAMIREVTAAPKPGLVDRTNSGSHKDMDLNTFLRSARTLAPWFGRIMAAAGDAKTDRVLPALRGLGREAEDAMRAATGGVNTHKGLIFSLGLICACLVRTRMTLGRSPRRSDIPLLRQLIRLNTSGITGELKTATHPSHGQRVYETFGLKGIRQEAEDAFPAVFETGLPRLAHYLTCYDDPDLPLILTLLELILVTGDTNLVKRGGPEGLAFMREESARILRAAPTLDPPSLLRHLETFDQEAIRRGLSPGGAADNLALTLFLNEVLKEEAQRPSEQAAPSPTEHRG